MSNENQEEQLAEVRRFALIFVGIGVLTGVANFIMVSMYGLAGEHLTARLRSLLFQKLLQQEIAFYDDKNHATGALCAKLSGETAAVQGVSNHRFVMLNNVYKLFNYKVPAKILFVLGNRAKNRNSRTSCGDLYFRIRSCSIL